MLRKDSVFFPFMVELLFVNILQSSEFQMVLWEVLTVQLCVHLELDCTVNMNVKVVFDLHRMF